MINTFNAVEFNTHHIFIFYFYLKAMTVLAKNRSLETKEYMISEGDMYLSNMTQPSASLRSHYNISWNVYTK